MKVLKFEASWCNPCKVATNILNAKGIEYTPVDVDKEKDLVEKFEIMSVPTVVVLNDNGNEVKRFVGLEQIFKGGINSE